MSFFQNNLHNSGLMIILLDFFQAISRDKNDLIFKCSHSFVTVSIVTNIPPGEGRRRSTFIPSGERRTLRISNIMLLTFLIFLNFLWRGRRNIPNHSPSRALNPLKRNAVKAAISSASSIKGIIEKHASEGAR